MGPPTSAGNTRRLGDAESTRGSSASSAATSSAASTSNASDSSTVRSPRLILRPGSSSTSLTELSPVATPGASVGATPALYLTINSVTGGCSSGGSTVASTGDANAVPGGTAAIAGIVGAAKQTAASAAITMPVCRRITILSMRTTHAHRCGGSDGSAQIITILRRHRQLRQPRSPTLPNGAPHSQRSD